MKNEHNQIINNSGKTTKTQGEPLENQSTNQYHTNTSDLAQQPYFTKPSKKPHGKLVAIIVAAIIIASIVGYALINKSGEVDNSTTEGTLDCFENYINDGDFQEAFKNDVVVFSDELYWSAVNYSETQWNLQYINEIHWNILGEEYIEITEVFKENDSWDNFDDIETMAGENIQQICIINTEMTTIYKDDSVFAISTDIFMLKISGNWYSWKALPYGP
jgi:hypothetical protein